MIDKVIAVITIVLLVSSIKFFLVNVNNKAERYGYIAMVGLAIIAVFIGGILY